MLGVTIGIGAGWREAAGQAARCMSELTGLRCVVLTDDRPLPAVVHPSWLKAHLLDLFPDEQEFCLFDADLLPRKPWSPEKLFADLGRVFCAVPDRNTDFVRQECERFGLPFPDWYVNAGLVLFSRAHAPVWEYVRGKHPEYGRWLEQTALNEALLKLNLEVARLPRQFNRLFTDPAELDGEINSHPAGIAFDLSSLSALQSALCPPPRRAAPVNLIGGDRLALLDALPPGSVGAEVGVFRGDFSAEILARVRPRQLHLVDRFAGQVCSDAAGQMVDENMSAMPAKLRARFAGQPIELHASPGYTWLAAQPEASLDWVYLDSDHSHFNTRLELDAALRAVKPGGIIAGHDFYAEQFPGVVLAVTRFAREWDLTAEIFNADEYASFRIVRPATLTRTAPPQKLFLALPVYNSLDTFFAQSLLKLLNDPPCNMQMRMNPGDSLVSRSRNSLTNEFLESDCSDLLFVDTDLIFSTEHVARILKHEADIVGGFYPKKQEGDLAWVCNSCFEPQAIRPDGLQRVRYMGTGFLRVSRRVFERMALECGERLRFNPDHSPGQTQYDFWTVGVYEYPDGARRHLSEDWYFCQRALDLGFEVWGDTKIVLKHVGQAVYPLRSQTPQLVGPPPFTPGADNASRGHNAQATAGPPSP